MIPDSLHEKSSVEENCCWKSNLSSEICRFSTNQKADNKTEETEDRAEDLDDENLDESVHKDNTLLAMLGNVGCGGNGNEQARVRRICQSCTTSVDTDRDTTDQIACAHCDTSPEECIARVIIAAGEDLVALDEIEFRRKHDSHDNSVDSDDFTENNRDQVLRPNPWSFDTTADNR